MTKYFAFFFSVIDLQNVRYLEPSQSFKMSAIFHSPVLKIVDNNNHHKDERKAEGSEASVFSEENKSAFDVSEMDVNKLKQCKTKFFECCSVMLTLFGSR